MESRKAVANFSEWLKKLSTEETKNELLESAYRALADLGENVSKYFGYPIETSSNENGKSATTTSIGNGSVSPPPLVADSERRSPTPILNAEKKSNVSDYGSPSSLITHLGKWETVRPRGRSNRRNTQKKRIA